MDLNEVWARLEHRIELLKQARNLIDEAVMINHPDSKQGDIALVSAIHSAIAVTELNYKHQKQQVENIERADKLYEKQQHISDSIPDDRPPPFESDRYDE